MPQVGPNVGGGVAPRMQLVCNAQFLVSFFCLNYSQARYVLLTDLNPITVQNLQYNITLNQQQQSLSLISSTTNDTIPWSDRVHASTIDWLDRKKWPRPPPQLQPTQSSPSPTASQYDDPAQLFDPRPPPQLQPTQSSPSPTASQNDDSAQLFDVVLGSDLIYQASTAPMLRNVIAGLLRRGGTFYYVAPSTTGRDGLLEFIESLQQDDLPETMANGDDKDSGNQAAHGGFQLVAATEAPKHYHDNPLCSQDDDDFFLHFHEMTSSQYTLYEFVKL
jgi:predicted nicotinamide N-methyase